MPACVSPPLQELAKVDDASRSEAAQGVRNYDTVTERRSAQMLETKAQRHCKALSPFTSRSPSTLAAPEPSGPTGGAPLQLNLDGVDGEAVQRLSAVEDTARLVEEREREQTRQRDGNMDRTLLPDSPFASGLHTRCPSRESLGSASEEDKTMQLSPETGQIRKGPNAGNCSETPQKREAKLRRTSGDRWPEKFQGDRVSGRCERREPLEPHQTSVLHVASKTPALRHTRGSGEADRGDGRLQTPQHFDAVDTADSTPRRFAYCVSGHSGSPTIRSSAASPKLPVWSARLSSTGRSPASALLDADRLSTGKGRSEGTDCMQTLAALRSRGGRGPTGATRPSRQRAAPQASYAEDGDLQVSEAASQQGAPAAGSWEGSETQPSDANGFGLTDEESCEQSPEPPSVEPTPERRRTPEKRNDVGDRSRDSMATSVASSTSASETFASDLKDAAEGEETDLDGDEEEQLRAQLVRLQQRLLEVQRRQHSHAESKCREAPAPRDPMRSRDRLLAEGDCGDSEAQAASCRTSVSTADGSRESAASSPGGKENIRSCQTVPSCEPLPENLRGGAAFAADPLSALSRSLYRTVLQGGGANATERTGADERANHAARCLGFQAVGKENEAQRGRPESSVEGMTTRFRFGAAAELCKKRKHGDTYVPPRTEFHADGERELPVFALLSTLATGRDHADGSGSMQDRRLSRLVSSLTRSESAKTGQADAAQLLLQLLAAPSTSGPDRAAHRWPSGTADSPGAFASNVYHGVGRGDLDTSAPAALWSRSPAQTNALRLERAGFRASLLNLLESTLARAAADSPGTGNAPPASEEWRVNGRGDYSGVQGSFPAGGSNGFSLPAACEAMHASRFRRAAAFLERPAYKASGAESGCDVLGRGAVQNHSSAGSPGVGLAGVARPFAGVGCGFGDVPQASDSEGAAGGARGEIRLGDAGLRSPLPYCRVGPEETVALRPAGEGRFGDKELGLPIRENGGLAADGARQAALSDERASGRDFGSDVALGPWTDGPEDGPFRAVRGVYFDVTNQAWAANMRVNGKVQKKSFSLKRYGKSARQRAIQARREMEREFGRSVSHIVRASNFFDIARGIPEEDTYAERPANQARGFEPQKMCVQGDRELGRATPKSPSFGSCPSEASLAARALLQHMQQDSAARAAEGPGQAGSFLYPHAVATRLLTLSRLSQPDSAVHGTERPA
ncbi:unnamed protein product [Neospora caninum Liverpool]|nr:uncharacterized protein NCLIV_044800 [Neospora caninum Liverpool]CBZ51419.1 unnamed protein product [Neospora caninum Liverpool]|eukprot:XP_003881452.1 uncharacterized protein NCLIV_044800 [Neospora caninum Liverpool]